ncbi:TetR/AcrR family transcriptional regulator [Gordonia sp. NPDC003425]
MSTTRADILRAAREILVHHSLADLSMRRLATEVGVRPNALYWHFPDKQTLLAALADDILHGVSPTADTRGWDTAEWDTVDWDAVDWDRGLADIAVAMRRQLLRVPDSAEVVSSAWASGLASRAVADHLTAAARAGGLSTRDAHAVSTAICQLIIGLTIEEQTRAQMERLGVTGPSGRDFDAEFTDALGVLIDGARMRSTHLDPGQGPAAAELPE